MQQIEELKEAINGVRYHHERYDGTGYPEGLKNGEIPIIAAIIGVADAYDAISSNRPYRTAKEKNEAVEEIKRESGKQFYPLVVTAFVQLCEEGKV